MNPLDCKPENIWNYAQNKPSLIAQDMAEIYGVPPEGTLRILMARGVFKWLNVRRELIKLKNGWKKSITEHQYKYLDQKCKLFNNNKPSDHFRYGYTKGYHDALTKCRNEVRALCHSERWVCPDFDEKAMVKINTDGNAMWGG